VRFPCDCNSIDELLWKAIGKSVSSSIGLIWSTFSTLIRVLMFLDFDLLMSSDLSSAVSVRVLFPCSLTSRIVWG